MFTPETNACASHIRGRIVDCGRPKPDTTGPWWTWHSFEGRRHYLWEVVNVATGAVVNSDNCLTTLERAAEDCAVRVEVARRAYVLGIHNKQLEARH